MKDSFIIRFSCITVYSLHFNLGSQQVASQSDQAQSWNVRYRRQSGVLSGADRSPSKQTILPQNRYQNQGQRGGLGISGKVKLLKEFS